MATVSYEYEEEPLAPDRPKAASEPALGDTSLRQLIVALDAAERDPRFREFVGFKLFRDQYLPQFDRTFAEEEMDRQRLLTRAIDEQLILTGKVPNPKSPANPVTSIRLNRAHPQVQAVLQATQKERSPFRPQPIRGENLSATVLAERR